VLPVSTRRRPRSAAGDEAPALQLGLWLASLGTSLCADSVFFLALTWAAIQVGSAGQVGMVVAAASLPRLAILLFGGSLADRVNPRILAAASDLGRALAVATAFAVVLTVHLQIWHLVVIGVTVGALDGFFMPAIGAIPALIAPVSLMARVGALRAVVQRVAVLVAGPIAGTVIAWRGRSAGFATAGLMFLLSVAFLLMLLAQSHAGTRGQQAGHDDGVADPLEEAARPASSGSLTSDLAGGFAVVRRHPVLPWMMLLVAALNLGFAGPVTAGLPLLADQQLWGASGAGLLLGGFGLGAAVTGLTLVFVPRVPRAGALLLTAFALMGLAIAAFAFAGTLVVAIVEAVVLGLGSGVVSSIVYGTLLTATPAAALGRVMALVSITLEGTFPISNYLTGMLTQAHSADLAFLIGGGLLVAAAAAAATRPAIRQLRAAGPSEPASTRTEALAHTENSSV
jgi:MFS family permease